MMSTVLICLLILCHICQNVSEKIQLERVEQIYADKTLVDFSHIHAINKNGLKVLIGEALLHTSFGNNIFVEYHAYVRRGGQYERIYHAAKRPLCDFFATDNFFYPDLARNSDFPEDIRNQCPLNKKIYRLKGVVIRMERIPRDNIKAGDYMAEIRFYIRDVLILQWRLHAYVA